MVQSNFEKVMEKIYTYGINMAESFVVAHLQKNPYTNLITNILAGGLRGGGINGDITREIIFDEQGNAVCGRKYSTMKGEKPLRDINDITFNRAGQIVEYSARVSTVDEGKKPQKIVEDNLFEYYGGLRAMTGGVFLGLGNDLDIFGLKDRSGLYKISTNISKEHYLKKAKLMGTDPVFGRKFYKAEVPVTENPFKIFDPREYDLELMLKYFKQGIIYSMLNIVGDPAKLMLSRLGLATDPAIEIQTESAYALSKNDAIGTLALTAYPAIFLFNLAETLLGYPTSPIKKSQSIFTMPSRKNIRLDSKSRLPQEKELYTTTLIENPLQKLLEAA